MKKLLPILFILIGLGGGVGVGMFLKPVEEPMAECVEGEECPEPEMEHYDKPENSDVETAFATLKKQFVISVVTGERVSALVVTSIALEVDAETVEMVFQVEPKLRDAFLQVLFVHAQSGGFEGNFLMQDALDDLRGRLYEVARPIVGDILHNVLLTEIVRQDI